MNRFIPTIIFLFLYGQISLSQTIDQNKLLAANHIKEKRTYKCIPQNGKLTGDSVLISLKQYNASGYPVAEMTFDTAKQFPNKIMFEYLHDSILLKTTFYKNDNSIYSEYHLIYDSLGHHIQTLIHFLSHSEKLPDTIMSYRVYDDQNHLIEAYSDAGKGQEQVSKYEYDARGNMVKWYNYFSKDKAPTIKVMEYDARNNISSFYDLNGDKRNYLGQNTYNSLGQCVEKRTIYWKKVKKHFYSLTFHAKKKHEMLVRYYYDESGLLVRQMHYSDSTLYYQYALEYTAY